MGLELQSNKMCKIKQLAGLLFIEECLKYQGDS